MAKEHNNIDTAYQHFSQDDLNLMSETILVAQKSIAAAAQVLFGPAAEEVKKQLGDLASLNEKICSYMK